MKHQNCDLRHLHRYKLLKTPVYLMPPLSSCLFLKQFSQPHSIFNDTDYRKNFLSANISKCSFRLTVNGMIHPPQTVP